MDVNLQVRVWTYIIDFTLEQSPNFGLFLHTVEESLGQDTISLALRIATCHARFSWTARRYFVERIYCYGSLSQLHWILGQKKALKPSSSDLSCIMITVCLQGDLEKVQFLDTHFCPAVCLYQDMLIAASRGGHLALVEWLVETKMAKRNLLVTANVVEALRIAGYGGHLEISKWLMAKLPITGDQLNRTIDTHLKIPLSYKGTWVTYLFQRACELGHLEMAKWVHHQFHIVASQLLSDENQALAKACRSGALPVVEWLIEEFHLDVLLKGASCLVFFFWAALRNGHSQVARWIAETFQFNKEMSCLGANQTLKILCKSGNLDDLKWFVATFEIRSAAEIGGLGENSALCYACCYNQVHIAEWLVQTFKLTSFPFLVGRARHVAHVKDDFVQASGAGFLQMVQWLDRSFHLINKKNIDFCYRAINSACYSGHLPVVKWLIHRLEAALGTSPFHAFYQSVKRVFEKKSNNTNNIEKQGKNLFIKEEKEETVKIANDLFNSACWSGNLDLVRWLSGKLQLSKRHLHRFDNEALAIACFQGDLLLVQYLVANFALTAADFLHPTSFPLKRVFEGHDHVMLVKWIFSHFNLAVAGLKNLIPQLSDLDLSASS